MAGNGDGDGITRRTFLKSTCALGTGLGLLGLTKAAHGGPTGSSARLTEARYYQKLDDQEVWCRLCFRKCIIKKGERGYCRNRENRGGTLYTLVYGRPCALQIDPIEKEPVYHLRPGSTIFCSATAGCNFRCKFCQNWHLSQKSVEETRNHDVTPEQMAELAARRSCDAVSFTYSEPTAFYEYMFDVAKAARAKRLGVVCHSNGAMLKEPLMALLKLLDAITIDLKGFSARFYNHLSTGELEPVLNTLTNIKKTNVHLEIVNLMIPEWNDDPKDVRAMCVWIKENLGTDVPLHVNRFTPTYRLTNLPRTPVSTLDRSYAIAREEGLKFVYVGNVPGHKHNSTYCPKCGKVLLKRFHFAVLTNDVVKGKCKSCGCPIPGIWDEA